MLFFVLFTIGPLPASIVQFNGGDLPHEVGWIPIVHGTPEINTINGVLIQGFDSPGDQAFYNRSISEYAGSANFFAEWRMQTDAPASLLDTLQTPAAFVLYGNTSVFYHLRFTDSVTLFTRSNLSLGYFAIEPGTFHEYRLELLDDATYRFLIDGTLVESDNQPGPYPTPASEIVWGAEFDIPGHTTQWDYIRYGVIPEPATATLLLIGTTLLTLRRKSRTQ